MKMTLSLLILVIASLSVMDSYAEQNPPLNLINGGRLPS
jgi:hypothetical protein